MKRQKGRSSPDSLAQVRGLTEQGKWEEAWKATERLLSREPNNARLGVVAAAVLRHLGRTKEALLHLRRASDSIRDEPSLWLELSQLEELAGDRERANAAYANVLRLGSTPAIREVIAEQLERQGMLVKAYEVRKGSWEASPQRPEEACRLAKLAFHLGEYASTIDFSLKALRLKSDYWEALFYLAAGLQKLGHLKEAVDAYHSLLLVRPNDASVYQNLGSICMRLGLRAESIRHFKRAFELAPALVHLECDLIHQQLFMHDWEGLEERAAHLLQRFRESDQAVVPFALFSIPGVTPGDLKVAAERRCRQVLGAAATSSRACERALTPKDVERRIRLGYLSSDFCDHATSHLMVRLFELHDRARFELYAYDSTTKPQGEVGQRVTRAFDVVRKISGTGDHLVEEMIRADEIDILIDLKGHTEDNRLGILAGRPAPVQVHHVGFPGTTGARFVDYLIADKFVAPPERAGDFEECLAYLPGCYQPTDATRIIGAQPSRTECGLPERGFVFCSFNQSYKITPDVFDLWCTLLRDVQGSVLWLMSWTASAEENLRREAVRRGVDGTRLIYAPLLPQSEHLGRLQNADLFLDTLPVNAHTTASDALWASVPVVTRPGETFVSRVAGSLLTALGLSELVAHSAQEYVDLARELALVPARLSDVRQRLRRARTDALLFDSVRYTRNLEALYELMWRRCCAHLPPAPLALEGADGACEVVP